MPSPHTTTAPAPRTQHRWSGHVAVDDPHFEGAARNLAEGTGRPLTRRSLNEAVDLSSSEPVTLVGPIEAATQADLPARAMLGLFLSTDADAADVLREPSLAWMADLYRETRTEQGR